MNYVCVDNRLYVVKEYDVLFSLHTDITFGIEIANFITILSSYLFHLVIVEVLVSVSF